MGSIASNTKLHAYRHRTRNRRQVVADISPDSSGDEFYGVAASNYGLDSIESMTFETPVIRDGATLVAYDRDNTQIDAWDASDGSSNTTDLSGETITATVVGPVE